MITSLPRVATPQKAFVLQNGSQVWEAIAGRDQVCTPCPTPRMSGEGTGNTGLEGEARLEGLSDEGIRWRETDDREASKSLREAEHGGAHL